MSGSKINVKPPRLATISRQLVGRRAYLQMLFRRVGAGLTGKRFSSSSNTVDRDNGIGLSVFDASTVRDYARALPEGWQARRSANDREAGFEAFDPSDLPRFLNNPNPAGPYEAPAADTSSIRPGRLADARTFVGLEASLMRERLRPQKLRSTIELEAFAYIAAFVGLVFLVWGCVIVLQGQPKVAQRHAPAGAIAQQSSTPPPKPVAAARRSDLGAPSARTAPASDHAAVLATSAMESRLNFAPHFEKFGFQDYQIAFQPFPAAVSQPSAPDKSAVSEPAAPAQPPSDPQSGNLGYVIVRNLPPEMSLSLGTRVSATDWALSQSDVAGLVMALAKSPEKPIKAEFEVFNKQGVSTGASLIEIRQAPADAIALPVKAPPAKAEKAARRPSVRRSSKRPPAPPPPATSAGVQPPPTANAAATPPTVPANKPGSGKWPPTALKLPWPSEPSQPPFGFSFGQ